MDGRRREEEEEEEKKKRRRGEAKIQKGMETNLDYGFYEIWYGSLVLYRYYLASNLGLLGFHPNQRCIEIRVGKTLKGTR